MIDLTLALTVHSETHVAGPTLLSIKDALHSLTQAGFTSETLVGFDSAPDNVSRFIRQGMQDHPQDVRFFDYCNLDQGATRNALAQAARGHCLAFVDADDLVSENWLRNAVALVYQLERDGQSPIIHPELNWQFDGINHVYSNPAQSDPFFSGHVMAIANYYDAMCVGPTRLWQELPFAERDLENGFALEDYQWFVEATDRGWHHAVAPGTIVFKRRRDTSQHRNSSAAKALIRAIPALAIDRIRHLGRKKT